MENYGDIVEKINETFTKGDTEGFLSYCNDDLKWTIVGEETVTGKDAVRSFMAQMEGCEPPAFGVDAMAVDGDNVAAHGSMTMKDENGKEIAYRYCDFYRFKNGLVSELTSYIVKTTKGEESDASN